MDAVWGTLILLAGVGMMPHTFAQWRLLVILASAGFCLPVGCTTPLFRGASSESPEASALAVEETFEGPRLVGDLAAPVGLNYQRVEAVGLVTQLDGTGSDPPPSPMRDELKKEMQTHNVRRVDETLSSNNTAMVIIRGAIPPGAVKGDVFDVEVRAATGTDTTSLRNGWLMSARLRERAVLNNAVHTGHVAAIAQGSVLCDALFDTSGDGVLATRGRVLGGGVVQLDRPLGLAMRDEHVSVKTSAMIGTAINERFHDFDRGTKRGLANPTRDNYIELKVHSRYRENIARYIQVVRHITVGETPVERLQRMTDLEKKLFEPTTAQRAALQLEAIGSTAVPVLRKALAASDPEVQFYAAEALAYLDDGDAIATLFQMARSERAFRWRAMLALSVLDQFAAQEKLQELMNSPSAETRYGAFRVLRIRNPRDPIVAGEVLNDEFALHVVNSTGEPLIHIARAKRPEIVLFGQGQKLEAPSFVFAGKDIIVKRNSPHSVKVTRYSTSGDAHEVCSTELVEVIRTIARLGGGYADVMQAVDEAKSKGFLAARVEVGAMPGPGRRYHRAEPSAEGGADTPASEATESIPDLFLDRLRRDSEHPEAPVEQDLDEELPPDAKRPWYDRLTAWMVD